MDAGRGDNVSYLYDPPVPDHVRNASYLFISKYADTYGIQPSVSLFNRFIILFNREAKDELGYDIRMPHCWYRWGDMFVGNEMKYIRCNCGRDGKTTVSFCGQAPDMNADEVDSLAGEFADSFIREHGSDTDESMNEVYADAPFEFIIRYRELRDLLEKENDYERIRNVFDETMSSFPKEFDPISKHTTSFVTVFRECIVRRVRIDCLSEIAVNYWGFFCRHLRMICNENISHETLGIWESKIDLENDRYESFIQNYAYEYCCGSKDEHILKLLSDREKELDELKRILEELRC